MSEKYVQIIKMLRIERGISQLQLAKKLGISRPSYKAIEDGKRELTLSEFNKLASLFRVSPEEIEKGMIADYRKYKQMILVYLRNADSPDGKIPKTKLAKLLYLADFSWFYATLQSMSGMQYRKLQFGPVPDMFFRALDELEDEGKIIVDRKTDAGREMILIKESDSNRNEKITTLSKEEKVLIIDIAKKWKGKKTNEIVNFTHNQLPYKICANDEIIPYELITQEDPDHVY